jgi:hypothetical protein
VTGGGYGAFLAVIGIIVFIAALIAPVFAGGTHWSGTQWSESETDMHARRLS